MKRIFLSTTLSILAVLAAACAAGKTSTSTTESAPAPAMRMSPPGVAGAARTKASDADDAALVERLIELAGRDNRVQDHLRHLCLSIGPRLTSSHSLASAQQWALDQFKSFGLEANLERWGEFPVGFDRGPFRGSIVGPDAVPFEFTTMAWTAGTNGPTRGRVVIKPETEAQLAEVQDRLAGAWLVTRVYEKGAERPKVSKEEKEKITAALAAADIAGDIRSGGRELVITDGNYRVAWDKLPQGTHVVLRGDQLKDLSARVEKGEELEVEFDIDNRFYEGPVPQYNVIADIRGSELPDEYVIVGGHLDSWDGAQGAVDNGTGCATTIEAARLLMASGARPRRTIRFILWSGEEQGLFGSTGYVRDHKADLDRISAVYIHDGGTNYLSGLGVTYDMEDQMRKVCEPIFGLNPDLPFKLRVNEGFVYSADSDHAPFAGAGVPGFFWDQAGKSDYNHMHHTQYDTFETAVPEYQAHSALVAAIVAYNTANLPGLLNRDNFKPLPPRRMGVQFEGAKVSSISKGGKAEEAGWKTEDVVVSVDGVAVSSREEISEELQKGGPKKKVVLRRGSETIEALIDYSGGKDEELRAQRAQKRAERKTAEQKRLEEQRVAEQKKFW